MTIDDLPNEILSQILSLLPPNQILQIQRVSFRFYEVIQEPLLWRSNCRTHFKYWHPIHRISDKFRCDVGDVDWKTLYADRCRTGNHAVEILDSILSSQIGRIKKFEQILQLGYDAKDVLLRESRTPTGHDRLARQYYANAVLDFLHRSMALELWWKMGEGVAVPLERALGAFDFFILHDHRGDSNEISLLLNKLTAKLRSEVPHLAAMSPRDRALRLAIFLREHNLTGLASEQKYRDLQNNYIGIALHDDDHPSLPLISAAIFCSLAVRIDLNAHCCAIPGHVYAVVVAKDPNDLDGRPAHANDRRDRMYLDPYRSSLEIPLDHLERLLLSWGVDYRQVRPFLSGAATGSIVNRTSRNILSTVQVFREQSLRPSSSQPPSIKLYGNPLADLDSAVYSALWANYMLSSDGLRSNARAQHEIIPLILDRFERQYLADASLIWKYIVEPAIGTNTNQLYGVREKVRLIYKEDSSPKKVQARTNNAMAASVKYRVGQVFRHKKYHYTSVIIGWDPQCAMGDEWIAINEVDTLGLGRHQSFYHALVEDTSTRYVAEENIAIITPEIPESLMALAGQYFKRWDWDQRVFVSNIRNEYPDD